MDEIRQGSTVRPVRRLRGKRNHKETAHVRFLRNDGTAVLDRPLDGFFFWKIENLEPVATESA